MLRTIDSPRPVPGIARCWTSADRKNRSNSRACSAWVMPMPVS